MKPDIPEGWEKLFGSFDGFGVNESLPDKPMIPHKCMTTAQLLKCMEHNARIIKNNTR